MRINLKKTRPTNPTTKLNVIIKLYWMMLWLNQTIDHKVAQFISRCLGIDFVPRRLFMMNWFFITFNSDLPRIWISLKLKVFESSLPRVWWRKMLTRKLWWLKKIFLTNTCDLIAETVTNKYFCHQNILSPESMIYFWYQAESGM